MSSRFTPPAEMRAIHLDAVGGVAGDMFVAALLDAMPDLRPRVLADIRAVLPAQATAGLAEGRSGAVRALRFAVQVARHDHHHDHDHHHAHYSALMARIDGAALAEGTARHAGAILAILAEAEARIHDVPVAEVHFHEIADWDSLADVVAAGSLAAALDGTAWTVSALPRGGGLVRTQHGLLPVPAPATAAILTGFTWRDDGVEGERVTPTGAAILRHLNPAHAPPGPHRLLAAGTGAGTRDLPGLPNILRALVFETAATPIARDRVAVIECDIDDMTGEEIAEAAERLRGTDGVLDVSLSAAMGKKNRPVTRLCVLAREAALHPVGEACLLQTATLGLRWRIEDRLVLDRAAHVRPDGLRMKQATRPDGRVTAKVESDDLRAADSLAERRLRQHDAEYGGTS